MPFIASSQVPRVVMGVLLAAAVLSTGDARAETANAAVAEQLFQEGKAAMAAGDYAAACPKLLESHALDPAGGTILFAAKCSELSGKLATAWVQYTEAAVMARRDGRRDRLTVAEERIAALVPKLTRLTLRVAPANASIPGFVLRGDGALLGPSVWGRPFPVNKGKYVVHAEAPGRRPFDREITVPDDGVSIGYAVPELELLPAPPLRLPVVLASRPPVASVAGNGLPGGRVAALILGGAGVAAAGVGIALGFVAKNNYTAAADQCPRGVCPPNSPYVKNSTDAIALGNWATVVTIAGLAVAGGAMILWFTTPARRSSAISVGLAPTFGSLVLAGTLP